MRRPWACDGECDDQGLLAQPLDTRRICLAPPDPTRDDPGMTRTRPVALATSLTLAVAGAVLLPAPGVQAQPRVSQVADRGDGGPNTYFSTPPNPLAARTKAPKADRRPKPPPTKGTVTGQVTGPNGTPIANALVTGIRFSDLGLPVDVTEEKRVLARTNRNGGFTLKQLREPYLIRVCSESVSGGGGGHRARRSGECDQESSKRFTPSYLGPDGNLNSWMRHTRFFRPQAAPLARPGRRPAPAVVTGTWKDGANRLLYLTRIDGSVAAQTITDDKGYYRFEVAPGPYRIEADRDEGLHTDSTVPGYLSKRLLLRAGRTVHDTFKTRHAGIIRGLVSTSGDPTPRPVPRDPRQARRLRGRCGHQRDRPLRRQLAQAGCLHGHARRTPGRRTSRSRRSSRSPRRRSPPPTWRSTRGAR